MGRPGKKPVKSMAQIMAERERQAQQNLEKRAGKIDRLVNSLDAPNAMLLLKDPRNLRQFAMTHNIRPEELQAIKAQLQKRAQE